MKLLMNNFFASYKMGIKNLMKYITHNLSKDDSIVHNIDISSLKGMTLAVDAFNLLYRHVAKVNYSRGPKRHFLEFLIDFIVFANTNNIKLIFIFDGKAPDEKNNTRLQRKEKRDKNKSKAQGYLDAIKLIEKRQTDQAIKILNNLGENIEDNLNVPPISELQQKYEKIKKQITEVDKHDIKNMKTLLKYSGITYITADGEAEKLCAQMTIDKIADACFSTDTDVLAYGSPFQIKAINTYNGICELVELKDVLGKLQFKDQKQFLDFCIMCGTDYNNNINQMGCVKAHRLLLKYGSIEEIEKNDGIDTSVLDYKNVRRLFNDRHKSITPEKLTINHADKTRIINLLRSNGIHATGSILQGLNL